MYSESLIDNGITLNPQKKEEKRRKEKKKEKKKEKEKKNGYGLPKLLENMDYSAT
jgi:hypothetical protein